MDKIKMCGASRAGVAPVFAALEAAISASGLERARVLSQPPNSLKAVIAERGAVLRSVQVAARQQSPRRRRGGAVRHLAQRPAVATRLASRPGKIFAASWGVTFRNGADECAMMMAFDLGLEHRQGCRDRRGRQ